MNCKLILGDCKEYMNKLDKNKIIIVTDPPFNIKYKYNTYKDNLPKDEYVEMLISVLDGFKSVVVLYPEMLHELSVNKKEAPKKIVSWVYNSNTNKQHRDIGFYNINPDFRKVRQPYKNQNDKRIKRLLAEGKTGAKLYDWWEVQQVKNVSKEKTEHPCQMPLEVMKKIIGILPESYIICDPFMGSGTTGVACKELNRDFIGIELDEKYFKIAKKRIKGE